MNNANTNTTSSAIPDALKDPERVKIWNGAEDVFSKLAMHTGLKPDIDYLHQPAYQIAFLKECGFLEYDNANVQHQSVFIHFNLGCVVTLMDEPRLYGFSAMEYLAEALVAFGAPDAVLNEDGSLSSVNPPSSCQFQ